MARVIIPTKDAEFDVFATAVAVTITAAPTDFGLGAPDAVAMTDSASDYHDALSLATDPMTRTHANVRAKDVQKGATLALFRSYLQDIKNNSGVSDVNKGAVGIDVTNNTPTPVPIPTTFPVFDPVPNGAGVFKVTQHDSAGGNAKPFGVIGALYQAQARGAGGTVPVDRASAVVVDMQTKRIGSITFDPTLRGQTITIWAAWMNRLGEFGPWSLPVDVISP